MDLNATNAAITAGYSRKTAYSIGQRLLKHVEIANEIQSKSTAVLDSIDISVERVLRGIGNLAFVDMRKLYATDGSLRPVHELDFDTQAGLNGVEIEKLFERYGKGQAQEVGTTTKVKVADRGLNLERLGRYHKLFTDKLDVNVNDSLAERLEKIRKRKNGRKAGMNGSAERS